MSADSTVNGYSRVYRRTGRLAHLVEDMAGANYHLSLCRMWPPPGGGGWRGTGNQVEYERAAALPLCPTCKQRAA